MMKRGGEVFEIELLGVKEGGVAMKSSSNPKKSPGDATV